MEKDEKRTIIVLPTKKDPVFGWHVKSKEPIGEKSRYANVFQVCKENDCDYVIKIIYGSSHKKIKKEVRLQKKCAKHGICKPVEDWWLINRKSNESSNMFSIILSNFTARGVIITPILDKTLKSTLEEGGEISRIWLKKAWRLLLKLHQINIIHNDSHYNNIMFDKKGNLFMIDMGMAIEVSPEIDPVFYYHKIMEDYYETVPSGLRKYWDIVLNILKENLVKYMEEEKLTVQEAEKRAVEELTDMEDSELNALVQANKKQGFDFLFWMV